MRNILFRGKRADNGAWVEGFLASQRTIATVSAIGNYDEIVIDPETVGQFTGLTDKNGKKIFEGDVVKWHFYYGFPCERHRLIGTVKFLSAEFKICGVKQYEGEQRRLDNTYEILGNIHDNPELFGESHEHH